MDQLANQAATDEVAQYKFLFIIGDNDSVAAAGRTQCPAHSA